MIHSSIQLLNNKYKPFQLGLGFFLLLNIIHIQAQPLLEIWEIQGDGLNSPYHGQDVRTENNVVTAIASDFFFIQTPTERSDNNEQTSDGLLVYTGSTPNVNVGDLVNVSGNVVEFGGMTEISGFNVTYTATGQTADLPETVTLTNSFPSSSVLAVPSLEQVEAMLVSFDADVVGPSASSEVAALAIGERPFREPGIPYPGQSGLPVWDNNPELFWFDPDALNGPNNRFLSMGMQVSATAVIYQDGFDYIAFPDSYSVSNDVKENDMPAANTGEFSIGSINVLQLVEDSDFLATKMPKLARYIIDAMGAPDILALQEVGDITMLHQLNYHIDQRDTDINYEVYLTQGNNNTSINVGYLVKPHIQDVAVQQLGNVETLSVGGRTHDRPPLLLEANLPTNPPTPIQVLNVHIRSLGGIEGSNANYVRTKRHEQAVSIAQMVQARQDDNLFVVGDFNAYAFTDGYVDVMAQITGQTSLGAEFEVEDIVSPALIDYAYEQEDENERYSFVYQGSATLLDHCLSTQLNDLEVTNFGFVRGNADAATPYAANPNITTRSSDHDGFVVYVDPSNPIVSTTDVARTDLSLNVQNPVQAGTDVAIQTDMQIKTVRLYNMQGQLLEQYTAHDISSIRIPPVNTAMYVLEWQTADYIGTERLMVIGQ